MFAYEVNLTGLQGLQDALRKAPQMVIEELERAVIEADELILHEVSDRLPVGVGGAAGLKGSLFAEQEVSPTGVIGVVGSPLNYAIPVELGTKPHFMGRQGIDSLQDWAVATLGITSEKAARSAAFAIAKKISVQGTVGKFPFQLGSIATAAGVQKIFDEAAGRIAARMTP